MSLEHVENYFKEFNRLEDIRVFDQSTATVTLAAEALGTEEKRIAKTLAFKGKEGAILIVAAGDTKTDNRKFKDQFGVKATMLPLEEVSAITGHPVGGVCPFALKEPIPIYLDVSLKRFETVFPACGSPNSAIKLTISELELYANSNDWVDVCKGWL